MALFCKNMTQPWWEGGPGSGNPPDADEANNALDWQWAASSGVDASPFFRIFNPDRQAQRFDPDGAFAARWLPEAAQSTRRVPGGAGGGPHDVAAAQDDADGSMSRAVSVD